MKIGDKVNTVDGIWEILQIKEGKGFKYLGLSNRHIYDVKDVELLEEKKKDKKQKEYAPLLK